MEIWLIRHGETDWNVLGRVQGWTDIPLNRLGEAQIDALGRSLEGIPFRHIYSSDLSRALDTAKAVARYTGTEMTITSKLRERFFGQAEGLAREVKEARYPNGAPDQETEVDIRNRVKACIEDAVRAHPHGRIALATHGGAIRAALEWLGVKATVIDNTSITRIRVQNGQYTVLAVNATPHLHQDDFETSTEVVS